MKKQPAPYVSTRVDPGPLGDNTIVVFEFEGLKFEMYDDEALRLAREIHDALQDRHATDEVKGVT